MRVIQCENCKRPYDFERDDFCPRCGAFNQPVKTWSTDAQGNVVRVDGVNENNHGGSFAHSEVHREKRVRKAVGLDRRPPQERKPTPPPRKNALLPVKLLFILIGGSMLLFFLYFFLFSVL